MKAYIIRRLLLIIPTLFLVSVIVFLLGRLIPGDVVDLMVAEQPVGTQLDRADIEHALGLDVPILVQYGRWLGVVPHPDTGFSGLLQGNLGESLWSKTPVIDDILARFPVSLELGLLALIVSQLIALPVGIYSALRQDTWGDYIARSVAIALIAFPTFWVGTMVIVLPSFLWGWSPFVRYIPFTENPMENLKILIIPGIILGMVMSGITMRMTRTMMLEVLRQDYIRTAWAKGLKERVVVMQHALKNALIPVVTIVGLQLALLVGGAVVLEQIFCIPGVGRLVIESITMRNYTMLCGINMFIATFVLLINLGTDLTYAYLDPRIHYR